MNEKAQKLLKILARPVKLERMIALTGQETVFPFYHTLSPEPLPHINHLYRVLKPGEFERDLDQLLAHFEPLSLGSYLEQGGRTRGRRNMVLSFDDGLKGCHEFIAPLLRKKGVPAVFFLNNRFIDNRGLFYRYRASLLIDRVRADCRIREKVAAFLQIEKEQVEASVLMIGWGQRDLLDALAVEAELEFASYLRARPVYMSSVEIQDLLDWGFELGGHSPEHRDFSGLDQEEVAEQVSSSVKDLQQRFGISTSYFSFPFTGDHVSLKSVDSILEGGLAEALLGTAGLKRTGRRAYIQRIPMEKYRTPALETIKSEYIYYLLKMPLGKNRLKK